MVGGGATPDQSLPTWLVSLEGTTSLRERKLRECRPPVIARVDEGRLLIDLRTVAEEEEPLLLAAFAERGEKAVL